MLNWLLVWPRALLKFARRRTWWLIRMSPCRLGYWFVRWYNRRDISHRRLVRRLSLLRESRTGHPANYSSLLTVGRTRLPLLTWLRLPLRLPLLRVLPMLCLTRVRVVIRRVRWLCVLRCCGRLWRSVWLLRILGGEVVALARVRRCWRPVIRGLRERRLLRSRILIRRMRLRWCGPLRRLPWVLVWLRAIALALRLRLLLLLVPLWWLLLLVSSLRLIMLLVVLVALQMLRRAGSLLPTQLRADRLTELVEHGLASRHRLVHVLPEPSGLVAVAVASLTLPGGIWLPVALLLLLLLRRLTRHW